MRLAERLAGRHVLLTGATGFVGEALLERVLADLPDTRVTVVVRGRSGEPAGERVLALLAKPAFAALRERDGADAVTALVGARLQVVDADLGAPLPPLPGDVDVLVHCAGEVSFDPPIDEGFRTNV
ncbi:MAG: HAD-superfamily subfamily hydrolase, partial [Frankiales bacterium]|nr:HAD-superfamily subfamily hydrolase [Frankiales bacterium]